MSAPEEDAAPAMSDTGPAGPSHGSRHKRLKWKSDLKRVREIEGVALRPHPYEFALYYDV